MKRKRLSVSLLGRSVGELTQSRDGLSEFHPNPSWEQSSQQPRLGLEFLRAPGTRSHATLLPAWFDNLLPEVGSELRARLCALHGLRDGQSYSLLRALGADLIGAVEVREHDAPAGIAETERADTNALATAPIDDQAASVVRASGIAVAQAALAPVAQMATVAQDAIATHWRSVPILACYGA